ncbi:T9SS type A sorting domain-containing protein, partial [bacterium]|nr:T9SS type A sorting domain-containing protein [bacterium]
FGIDVFGYHDGTTVTVNDITSTAKTTSGKTTVSLPGTLKTTLSLDAGEDFFIRNGVGNSLGYLEGGHTYHIHCDKPASAMFGALRTNGRGRDGASFVKDADGLAVGDTFYFYIPGPDNEREAKVTTYSNPATFTLSGWNTGTSAWVPLVSSYTLGSYSHYDYVGTGSIYKLFRIIVSSGEVATYIASWLETGGFGTSDEASFITSPSGITSGTEFVAFLPYPANQSTMFSGNRVHAYITAGYNNTTVTIKDTDTNGTIINTTINLDANELYDLNIDVATYTLINTGGNRPYITITSDKAINTMVSNWNDNWLTFAAGAIPKECLPAKICSIPLSTYTLVGSPIIPVDPDVGAVFGDAFGGIGGAGTTWRVSRWDVPLNTYLRYNELESGAVELGDPPDVVPGLGYWVYQTYENNACVEIDGSEVDQSQPYVIPLQGPENGNNGLNQLANPFLYSIDWANSSITCGSSTYTIAAAAGLGLVGNYANIWNGFEYVPISANYGGEIEKCQGFWFCVFDSTVACSLSIPALPLNAAPSPSPKKISDKVNSVNDWFLQISIADPTETIRDSYNAIGVTPLANDGFDGFDAIDYAPPKQNFVLGFFRHNDPTLPSYWQNQAGNYTYEFKAPYNGSTKVWDFEVYSYNNPNETFTLTWPNIADLPNEIATITMTDLTTNTVVDLKTQSSYSYQTSSNSVTVRKFVFTVNILTDVAENNNILNSYSLEQNYPNPFNPTTAISYNLKNAEQVELTVYNTLGQEVKTLVKEAQPSGSYNVVWDAKDTFGNPVASGIYFYTIKTEHFNQTRKMVLLK